MTQSKYWKFGTQIVQYEMWGERIVLARPVTVAEDRSTHIALYSHPMTPTVSRVIENRYALNVSERIDIYMQMLDSGVGEFREQPSPNNHVLTLTPPNSWHSVWLFWDSEWQFKNWYVNFQAPIRRLRRGIQVRDYALDITVRPDMTWSWKDVDEFEELIARGFFTDEQPSSIRAEAERMVTTIESGGRPFSDGWEKWRPDQRWPVPTLPEDWAGLSLTTIERNCGEPLTQ